jgi:hypothetical protein
MTRAYLLSASLVLVWTSGCFASPPPGLQNCSSAAAPDQRQRCDEAAFRQAGKSITTLLEGGWQLVKTKDPAGGADAVSVMHTVDSSRSDVGLAGLSLQCGPAGIEVVMIILDRLPRAPRPAVMLTAGNKQTEFEATVIQGGEALLLPESASNQAAGEWQNIKELSVEIATKPTPIRGAIPLGGLSAALGRLLQNCPAR